mgnify:FL=1
MNCLDREDAAPKDRNMNCRELEEAAPTDRHWMAHAMLEAGYAVVETSRRSWAIDADATPVRVATPRGIRTCYASAETSPERTANRTSPGTS